MHCVDLKIYLLGNVISELLDLKHVFSLLETLLCSDLFITTVDHTILRSEFICICDQSSSLKLLLTTLHVVYL
jgi:hypothetical protein